MGAGQTISPKAFVAGEIVFDRITEVRPDGSQSEPVNLMGGAPANFLYHLLQLGGSGALFSAVNSDDDLGKKALRILGGYGIDLSLVQKNAFSTGLVPVTKDIAAGTHTFDILPKRAFDYLVATNVVRQAALDADIIYYGTLALRDINGSSRGAILELLDSNPRALKFCDLNLRKDCWDSETLKLALRRASVVKLNDEEVPIVLQHLNPNLSISKEDPRTTAELSQLLWETINGLSERGALDPITLMVTQGKNGALAIGPDGNLSCHPGYSVPAELIRDTIGCGDAAAAGFVFAHLQGEPLEKCLELANRMGALVAMLDGAMGKVELKRELSLRVPEIAGLPGGQEYNPKQATPRDQGMSH